MKTAKLNLGDKTYELPVIEGSEGEIGIDIRKLRGDSSTITLDSGYANTGSCESAITFINGEEGILRYRGYPIEQLAENSSFVEVIYLLLKGELPGKEDLEDFSNLLTYHSMIHEDLKKFFEGFPPSSHPMTILSSMVSALSGYYHDDNTLEKEIMINAIRLLAKLKTIAAFSYKKSIGQPFVYPRNDLSYIGNFLYTMFATPMEEYVVPDVMQRALDLLLILHADHEQNCSAPTVRMVGSSHANLFASISAGISALSGPLHGGANQRVIQMLTGIHESKGDPKEIYGNGQRS